MKVDATVRFAFATPEDAAAACKALEPDHEGHMQGRVEGNVLVLTATSASALGMLRTLEDAIQCVQALGGVQAED